MIYEIEKAEFSPNNDLVVGSLEYKKVRYSTEDGKEIAQQEWFLRLKSEINKKKTGQWKFIKTDRFGCRVGSHPARNTFSWELNDCISKGLRYKTKTFEYIPRTGEIKVSDGLIGIYNSKIGKLVSFTIKNINTKLSRYRLRDFGIFLVKLREKTYWDMPIAVEGYHYLTQRFGNLETNKSLNQLFKSLKYISEPQHGVLRCELRENVTYVGAKNSSEGLISKLTFFPFHEYSYSDCVSTQNSVLDTDDIAKTILTDLGYIINKDKNSFSNDLRNYLKIVLPLIFNEPALLIKFFKSQGDPKLVLIDHETKTNFQKLEIHFSNECVSMLNEGGYLDLGKLSEFVDKRYFFEGGARLICKSEKSVEEFGKEFRRLCQGSSAPSIYFGHDSNVTVQHYQHIAMLVFFSAVSEKDKKSNSPLFLRPEGYVFEDITAPLYRRDLVGVPFSLT